MKRKILLLMALGMMCGLSGCAGQTMVNTESETISSEIAASETTSETKTNSGTEIFSTDMSSPESESSENDATAQDVFSEEETNILVAYFSCTGNTENIANTIAFVTGADVYKIKPEQPYTDADLDYNDSGSRSTKEQNDDSCRPTILGSVENFDRYDIIYVGYPIWWGQAPRIIYTFMESYDFSDKTVIPFCTSASSGVGSSADNLHDSASSAVWIDGTRLSSDSSEDDIRDWINGLGL